MVVAAAEDAAAECRSSSPWEADAEADGAPAAARGEAEDLVAVVAALVDSEVAEDSPVAVVGPRGKTIADY